jgi:hypothetical protein
MADAISTLSWLFMGGPQNFAFPGPFACSPDQGTKLACSFDAANCPVTSEISDYKLE